MRRVQPAERGKELPAFQLQIVGQTRGLHEGFLHFDFGFVVVVQFENNVRETFEVGIDCAIERELDIARVESALLRIVIAHFDVIEITRAGISKREQTIERNVHIIFAATNGDGLR